jgi:hypothetical protein
MAVSVDTIKPSSPPKNTAGTPATHEPQAMAARNSAPVSGWFWNITCPVPRSSRSTKRSAPERVQRASQAASAA